MNERFVFYYPNALTVQTGVNVAVWGWAEALAAAGNRVAMLYHGGDAAGRSGSAVELAALAWRGKGRWRRPVGLASQLDEGDVLILSSGYLWCNLVAGRIARRFGIPYLVVPHGAYPPGLRRNRRIVRTIWELAERRLLEGAAAVHLFFDVERDFLAPLAPKARVIVAPTGFDQLKASWTGDGSYLGWYGRYAIEAKGLDLLIEGMAAMSPAERPRLSMRGMPSKHNEQTVRALVAHKGLTDWISVEGPVFGDEKIAFLENAKGFIHTSRWEAQSIAIMEALSVGVPVMVSEGTNIAGPLREHNAAVVVSDDPVQIAEGIRQLLTADPAMGRRGRRLIDELFNWPATTKSFVDQVHKLPAR